ncbi:polysaccharide biosynthesis/export family protein [Salinisphaera hydrothermalis]|nr:polysaccharide biosynthesis/export family protein [Salinisphaera hydrothermalis]
MRSIDGALPVWMCASMRGAASAAALALLSLSAGCAMPGYSSDGLNGPAWYNFGASHESTYQQKQNQQKIDYEPRLVKITPSLIEQQNQKRSEQTVTPAEKKVSVRSKTSVYRLGPGDVLQVVVYGHPELTNPTQSTNSSGDIQGQLINADGKLYFPYVGQIKAAGLTTAQLRQKIVTRLSTYIRDPQVDVRVMKYRSQHVYISGDVSKPCTVPITDITLTLLSALDQCQSLSGSGSAARGSTSSGATSVGVQNVVLVRNGHRTRLDLNQIYSAGRSVPLQANDHLLIDDSANRVFMVGEFSKQMALPYSTGGMSLNDAIADAGGVSLDSANTSAIYVIRGLTDETSVNSESGQTISRPTVYRLNANSPVGLVLANQFELKPRDIVYAAPASLVNFNRAFAQITPALNTIFQTLLIYSRANNGGL